MFLSLNIHEALTFETEICLHPDFLSTTVDAGRQQQSLGSGLSSANNSHSTADAAPRTLPPLAAGDLIEIRVWDGPTTTTTTTNMAASAAAAAGGSTASSGYHSVHLLPSSVLRRRPSPPPPPPETPDDGESMSLASSTDPRGGSGSITTVTHPNNNNNNNNNTSSSVRGGGDSLTTTTITPHVSPRPADEHKTTTTLSLPPPFPRARASTTDSSSPALLLKPPPFQQKGGGGGRPPVRHSPKPSSSRHVRDISDISADTTLWAAMAVTNPSSNTNNTTTGVTATMATTTTTALDSTHQLVDLQVPFTAASLDDETADSHEDDDEVSSSMQPPPAPTHTLRLQFYMLLTEASLSSLKPSARTQVSLLRQVADLYHLSSYDMVTVHRVLPEDAAQVRLDMAAEFVLVTIKDQYLSRGDLHFFQQSLQGTFLYEGQRLHDTVRGMQAHAREIRNLQSHTPAPTGLVTEHTKIAYRSRSSRIFWLVQMSAELWDYGAPFADDKDDARCEVYFDKFMEFVYELFEKWKSVEVTHSLTVVFFSRTFGNAASNKKGTVQKDTFGRYYEDHYRLVIENETRTDWASLILQIRQAFWRYPTEVGWNLAPDDTGRWPSTAAQGNVLEAVNVTLNLLQYHYLDRDLHRTGNSIVVVSAGNGVFEVSKDLAQITYQRMMDNGIGSDMLSLGLPPLHTAPFFMYVKEHQAVGADGVDSSEQYFEVPHWMHLSFVSYESDTRLPTDKKPTEEEAMESALLARGRIEVGPNGFIRRHWIEEATSPGGKLSPRISPSDALPTAAASPTKQRIDIPQERQLIAGRDFSDILRASRPRFSAALPAPFRSLLKSKGREQTPATKGRDESVATTQSGGKSGQVREWNSTESDDASEGSIHIRRRGLSLGQDPRDGTSPVLQPKSPPRMDMLDTLSGGSPSSYATQFSGGALGSSFERQQEFLIRHHSSPRLIGMQLQRARSLELDTDDNDESESIGGVHSALATPISNAQKSTEKDSTKMLEAVKELMRNSDNTCFKPDSPKVLPQPPVDRTRDSSADASAPATGGGIAAALSQYRGSATSLSSETDGSAGNLSRVSSYGRIHNNSLLRTRIPEMISAGMSPLLLPPSQPSHEIAPETASSGPERRFVDTQRIGSVDGTYFRPVRGTPGAERRLKSMLASSPPKPVFVPMPNKTSAPATSKRSTSRSSKKKKAFNPFRQQDEDDVLAQKSHNRRRWSHVFPVTEIEFKRHAGPNWKSLSAPAILPISVDYFPPQAKIDLNFTISQYSINVSDFERRNFSSTKFLLMEMVRQRITQDFQLVPPIKCGCE